VGVAALVWFGGGAVIQGNVTFGVLYAFITYIRRFFQPINQITQQLNVLQSAVIASDRIGRTLREVPDIREPEHAQSFSLSGRIVFDSVHFAYRPGQPILQDIGLTIEPGQRVGFVGPSGAGKTSLMNILARFYDVTQGSINWTAATFGKSPCKSSGTTWASSSRT
jgi:ATP-binding cassette subfamily B multidrug efflux pump